MSPARAVLTALCALLVAGGCAGKPKHEVPPPARVEPLSLQQLSMLTSQFETHKAQWRAELVGPDSPLPPDRIASFPGIDFYPFAADWRFVGDIERLDPPVNVEVPDSHGKTQIYMDYARFRFEVHGAPVALVVYRPSEHPEQFFVPFTDSTSGGETYAGGRYAHLDSLAEHRFVLDFNQAYNPYCAYDSSWMCPIPPRENHVPAAVRAGMLAPPGHG